MVGCCCADWWLRGSGSDSVPDDITSGFAAGRSDSVDEAARNPAQRPFPFMPTLETAAFLADNLTNWTAPVIVYRGGQVLTCAAAGLVRGARSFAGGDGAGRSGQPRKPVTDVIDAGAGTEPR